MGGVGVAAEYAAPLPTDPESDEIKVRTVERKSGHWYVRLVDLNISIECPSGRTNFVLLDTDDVLPREIPIRRSRFRGVLRQVEFELEPFMASGTFVLSGRFGPQRGKRAFRKLRGSISTRTVGEGGTVCRGDARFTASRVG